jgi:hypothetical protein
VAGLRKAGSYLWLDCERLLLTRTCDWFKKGCFLPVAGLRKAGTRGCEMAAARPVRPSSSEATASFICTNDDVSTLYLILDGGGW